MTGLAEIRGGWDDAARRDAMFYIVTLPQYKDGGWPEDEFFALGVREVHELLEHLDGLELRSPNTVHALDFGCGVGRVTQALADEYDHVVGADVSPEMVLRARQMNRQGDRVEYVVNGESLLEDLPAERFDLVYSNIVLQHMPPAMSRGYIQEFVQLLEPDGLAVFELPDGPVYAHPESHLSMFPVPPRRVDRWVSEAGGVVVDIELTGMSGPQWEGWRYTARRT